MPRIHRIVPLAALVLAACGQEATVPTQKDRLAELNVDMVIHGYRHAVTDEGVRKAVMQGDTAYFRDTDSKVDLRGVKLDFFNETTGATSGTLTSRTGEYDMRTGAMTARGNAVLTLQGAEGTRTISSEELHYDVQGDRIWSDKPTVMKEGAREVLGTSFESDAKFQNVRVQTPRSSGVEVDEGIRF
jgi:LPS export ABC transporter protein LptC